MIQTTIGQLDQYVAAHPRFETAFAAIRRLAEADFQAGVTEIDGRDVYVNAIAYETRPREGSQFEAHRAYIDVMYLKSGREAIEWCPTERLTEITAPYDAAGDALLAALQPGTRLYMQPGDIAVFFPADAHCPGLQWEDKQNVEKYIVKVRVK